MVFDAQQTRLHGGVRVDQLPRLFKRNRLEDNQGKQIVGSFDFSRSASAPIRKVTRLQDLFAWLSSVQCL